MIVALVEGHSIRATSRMTGVAKDLRITPAMKVGVTNHVWEIEEIPALLDGNSN